MWKIFSQGHIVSTAGDALGSKWHVGEGNACQMGGGQRESGVEGLGDASNHLLGAWGSCSTQKQHGAN
jgi:hypothetical protein